jgi:hypothetical protein
MSGNSIGEPHAYYRSEPHADAPHADEDAYLVKLS